MTGPLYISAYCVVDKYRIRKNKDIVFELQGASPEVFLEAAYHALKINYPKFYKMDRLSQLGFTACEYLLRDSFDKSQYTDYEVAVVLSNASSSLDTDLKYYQSTSEFASPSLFVYTLPNIVIGEVCIRNQFKGENAFFVFKGFDATFIEGYVADLIGSDRAKACICGWVELLGPNYEAFLLLIETTKKESSMIFTKDVISSIYPRQDG